MIVDKFGQQIYSEEDLVDLYMANTELKLKNVLVDKPIPFSDELILDNIPKFIVYHTTNNSVEDFDKSNQVRWFMPDAYRVMDIAKFVLEQCKTDAELQRAGEELLLYQERDMFPLLKYLKYLVDTMRKNSIVWGVGRGSSVSSFVLYLLGVHRINSLYYQLDISEFLK